MRALGWWLSLVGFLRLSSVWFGFFNIWALRMAVFSKTSMTEIHGRTFGTWTLLTCTLCLLCATNLENRPLYIATLLSFVYALGHFATEFFIYGTMALKNLLTVAFFAGTSIVWMLLELNKTQGPGAIKHSWACLGLVVMNRNLVLPTKSGGAGKFCFDFIWHATTLCDTWKLDIECKYFSGV